MRKIKKTIIQYILPVYLVPEAAHVEERQVGSEQRPLGGQDAAKRPGHQQHDVPGSRYPGVRDELVLPERIVAGVERVVPGSGEATLHRKRQMLHTNSFDGANDVYVSTLLCNDII